MDLTEKDYLLIAGQDNVEEIFYTLEGEGEYIGQPSVFLRLFGCNLTCKGFASKDSPFGCDSFISWSIKNKRSFDEVVSYFDKNGFTDQLKRGAILKITGGEPMLRQEPLLRFVDYFIEKNRFTPRIDFETNASIMPLPKWRAKYNATFTTSPKLSNNGDPEEKRYVPDVLMYHKAVNSGFKFVISKQEDVQEVFDKYIHRLGIPRNRIWFMPCCGSRQEHLDKATEIAEWAKQFGVNFSPRLHLLLWDKALRV